jgi:hypothetical protein
MDFECFGVEHIRDEASDEKDAQGRLDPVAHIERISNPAKNRYKSKD